MSKEEEKEKDEAKYPRPHRNIAEYTNGCKLSDE